MKRKPTKRSIGANKAHATRAFQMIELAQARLFKLGWERQRFGVWSKTYASGDACTKFI